MKNDLRSEKVLIIDFGSQYTQLIARRVRELGVYSEIRAWSVDPEEIIELNPTAIILSGGPESVAQGNSAPSIAPSVLTMGIPVLGICYGMQIMASQMGGAVENCDRREFGYAQVKVEHASALLMEISDRVDESGDELLDVWMSHGDNVSRMPDGFLCIASTESCPIAGMADENKRLYGIQFHPEVTHTMQGSEIFFVSSLGQSHFLTE